MKLKKIKRNPKIGYFVKLNAGDVEQGNKMFNQATDIQASNPGIGVGEALKSGDVKKAEEIQNTIRSYEEKEDDQPYGSNKFEDQIKELSKKLEEGSQKSLID